MDPGTNEPEAIRDPGDAGRPTAGCGTGGSCTANNAQEAHPNEPYCSAPQDGPSGPRHGHDGLRARPRLPQRRVVARHRRALQRPSGQYGPALIDGTNHDDVIVGSDGDDTISAGAGDDQVCGAAGDDFIAGDSGNDAIRGDTGDDDLDGGSGRDTVVGDGGNDTVAGGTGNDFLVGGSGDDVMISADDSEVDKVNGGDDFDDCLFSAGDELNNCEY